MTNRYLHGPAVDQLLADEDALDNVLWPLAYNQGTVRDLVNSSGVVQNHLTYDTFGNITSETNATVDHLFAYTGREWDEDSDLYYYRARWYDPSVGRFLSEDPISFAGGDTNLSAYVGNSPTNLTDPSGLLFGGLISKIGKFKDLVFSLPSKIRHLTPAQRGLILDVGQLGLDIAGIVEPTPVADGSNFFISLFRRNFLDAGISLVGVFPYIGDLAKAGKVPKAIRTIHEAVQMAKKSKPMAKALLPVLEGINDVVGKAAKSDFVPQGVRKRLAKLQKELTKSITELTGQLGVDSHILAENAKKAAGAKAAKAAAAEVGAASKSAGVIDDAKGVVGREPNRIPSARELIRRAQEPGPFHNFPESFNQQIFRGNRQVISDNYILYTQRGTINGRTGTFEIGVRPSASGRTETILHRFFRPDPR